MLSKSPSMIEIARVTSPHGIRGDLKVRLYSDSFDEFCRRGFAYLQNTDGQRRVSYEALRVDPPFVYVHFDGVDTRNDAELMRNTPLFVQRDDLEPPAEGEHYIMDIIGFAVMADGKKLGVLKDVFQHGAADVYVVKGDRGFMFPALKRVVRNIDEASGVIEVDAQALGEVAVYDDL